MNMDGRIVDPVSLKLGNTTFPEVVHVAPIQDDMLLGLDFLLEHRVGIKLKELQLHIRAADERVPLEAVNSKMEQTTVAKVTAERVEQILACLTARVKSNDHRQERAYCILQPGENRRMNTSRTWFPLSLETATPCRMKCFQHPTEVFPSYWVPPVLVHILGEIPQTAKHHLDVLTCNDVSSNQDASDPADTEVVASPMRPERGTPVRQTRAFAPQALSEPSYVLYTYRLKNESNCVPEQVVTPYLLQCCLEIDTNGLILKRYGHTYLPPIHKLGTPYLFTFSDLCPAVSER